MATSETPPGTRPHRDQRQARQIGTDPAALDVFVAEHEARIAGLVRRLLGWHEEVEDVVQDVFVSALENVSRFRGECRIETWLFRITINRCRQWRRRWWLRLRRAPQRSARPGAASDPVERQETLTRVRAAVRQLPAADREVIVLRYLEALPIADIADILRLVPNAVEVRLSRARRRLRNLLGDLVED